jgi:hypothetical protein
MGRACVASVRHSSDGGHFLGDHGCATRPLRLGTRAPSRRGDAAAGHDPLIAVAMARLSLAEGTVLSPFAIDRLLAVDPADPIVAAAALDLAKRAGDAQVIGPARARLTALARTPGERAHALE